MTWSPAVNGAVYLKRRPESKSAVTAACFDVRDPADNTVTHRLPSAAFLFQNDADCAFAVSSSQEAFSRAELPPQCFIVETKVLSMDPFLRCRFNEVSGVDYAPAYSVGGKVSGVAVGEVIVSSSGDYPVGTMVGGDDLSWPWERYVGFVDGTAPQKLPPLVKQHPSWALGVLGLTGLTAYFGIVGEGKVGPGSVVLVSSAAGATGSAACDIAKILGATVIGMTSSDEKCAFLKQSVGVDAVVNYKSAMAVVDASEVDENGTKKSTLALANAITAAAGGQRVSVYFDNVGGDISDAALLAMAPHSTVVLCGQVSVYNDETLPYPPPVSRIVTVETERKAIRRERYLVLAYQEKFAEASAQLGQWLAEGKLKANDWAGCGSGLAAAPAAFEALMEGKNVGKAVVPL